jgi:hypothetical protein
MWNLNVPKEVQDGRMTICKKCKFYNQNGTKPTCGTPIIGDALTPEQIEELEKENIVSFYRRKTRLCGCYLRQKVKFTFTSCPVGKWGKYRLNEEETIELKKFIDTLPTKGIYKSENILQLKEWFSRITGSKKNIPNCPKCIKELISEIKQQLNHSED